MKPSRNGIADACLGVRTAALWQAPGGSLKKGRNNDVSALFVSWFFDSRLFDSWLFAPLNLVRRP